MYNLTGVNQSTGVEKTFLYYIPVSKKINNFYGDFKYAY